MTNLADALEHAFGKNPDFYKHPGVKTEDGVIVEWNPALGAEPTGAALQTILDDFAALQPFRDWKKAMGVYDPIMPRFAEHIIDSMAAAQLSRLDQIVKDNHAAKKTLRTNKPPPP